MNEPFLVRDDEKEHASDRGTEQVFPGVSVLPKQRDLLPPYDFKTRVFCNCRGGIDISRPGIIKILPNRGWRRSLYKAHAIGRGIIRRVRLFAASVTEVFNDPQKKQLYLLIDGKYRTYHRDSDLDLLISSTDKKLSTDCVTVELNSRTTI